MECGIECQEGNAQLFWKIRTGKIFKSNKTRRDKAEEKINIQCGWML
jgi:hypothetical protein